MEQREGKERGITEERIWEPESKKQVMGESPSRPLLLIEVGNLVVWVVSGKFSDVHFLQLKFKTSGPNDFWSLLRPGVIPSRRPGTALVWWLQLTRPARRYGLL